MLEELFNLRCSAGHRYFAPELEAWLERECGKALERELTVSGDVRKTVPRCHEPLEVIPGPA